MTAQVNFQAIADQVKDGPQIGRADLAVWGGQCPEDHLAAFLQAWALGNMPYRIWEYVSEISFEQNTLPHSPVLLERGRLFGVDGDLELRREGGVFLWRFVGQAGTLTPPGFSAQDYWTANPEHQFYCEEQTALLWGKHNGPTWADDRVGAAQLNYPFADNTEQRLQLRYRAYRRAGYTALVWFTALEAWKEA